MIYRIDENYFLRTLRKSDLLNQYLSWFEDQEVCKYNSHGKFFKTEEYLHSFYDSLNNDDKVVMAVCHEKDGHIGNVSLQCISLINRNAEFAILIGDRRHWNKSVGKLAGSLLISHGFDKLNLERVYCGTAATNRGMQSLSLALGFKEEGRRRAHLYLEGKWVDVIEYGLLRSEYRQKNIS